MNYQPLYIGRMADVNVGRTCVRCGNPAARTAHRIEEPGPIEQHPHTGETYRMGRLETWQSVCNACFVVGQDDAPEEPLGPTFGDA